MHAFYGKQISSLSSASITALKWTKSGEILWAESSGAIRISSGYSSGQSLVGTKIVTVGLHSLNFVSLTSMSEDHVIVGASSDGSCILWSDCSGFWKLHSTTVRSNSAVVMVGESPLDNTYFVLYDTGAVEIRASNGDLHFVWFLSPSPTCLAWSSDGQSIYAGARGEVSLYNLSGDQIGSISIVCVKDANSPVVGIECLYGGSYTMVAFGNGRCQIVFDGREILVDCQSCISWAKTVGKYLALVGPMGIYFFALREGVYVCSLGGPGDSISCVSWSAVNGGELAVGSFSQIHIVNIIEIHESCVFGTDMFLTIEDLKVSVYREGELQRKFSIADDDVRFCRGSSRCGLVIAGTGSTGEYCMYTVDRGANVARAAFGLDGAHNLVACDVIGTDVMVSDGVRVGTVSSVSAVVCWSNVSTLGSVLDPIVDLCVGVRSLEGWTMCVARESGIVHICTSHTDFVDQRANLFSNKASSISLVPSLLVECVARRICLNLDSSTLAITGIDGSVWLADLKLGTTCKTNRRNVIDKILWSNDSVNDFACIEKKNRLYVHCLAICTEEPISVCGEVWRFSGLEISVGPLSVKTKVWTDFLNFIKIGNIEDILQFLNDKKSQKLWDMFGVFVLKKDNVDWSLFAQIPKDITEDKVNAFIRYGLLDECEEYVCKEGRLETMVDLYVRIGEYRRLERLLNGDVEKQFYLPLATEYFENNEFGRAIVYYELSGQFDEESFIIALVLTNDYKKLQKYCCNSGVLKYSGL